MKKNKKWFRSPIFTVVAFALAAVLLLFSGINSARAALTYFSEVYSTQVQMFDIGVSLLEKGAHDEKANIVSYRNYKANSDGEWDKVVPGELLKNMLGKDEKLILNKEYKEELNVQNTGTINEFVRVTVYKYWVKDGKKMTDLSPDLIDLNLVNVGSAWVEDETERTDERTVLYYTSLLNSGDSTPLFADKIKIDKRIAKYATQKQEGNTIITTYDYDGVEFCIEATVDAVQEHNAQDAALSAWGRNVKISGKKLSLA